MFMFVWFIFLFCECCGVIFLSVGGWVFVRRGLYRSGFGGCGGDLYRSSDFGSTKKISQDVITTQKILKTQKIK